MPALCIRVSIQMWTLILRAVTAVAPALGTSHVAHLPKSSIIIRGDIVEGEE